MVSDGDGSKLWVALFTYNQLKETRSEFHFVSPIVSDGHKFIRFHSREIAQEKTKWKNALVGCVYGLKLRLERLFAFVVNQWKKYGLLNVSRINADLFLFQFNEEVGCNSCLKDGPFTFDN